MNKDQIIRKIFVDLMNLEFSSLQNRKGRLYMQKRGRIRITDLKDYFFREFGLRIERVSTMQIKKKMSENERKVRE